MDFAAPIPLKRLAAYRPPDWRVEEVALDFQLDTRRTLVAARLKVARNGPHDRPLLLDGEALETLAVALDGVAQPLPGAGASALSLDLAGDRAMVETWVALDPSANSRLMGLYASGGALFTQCEAEGFRRISWYPDRPDVLACFRVRLEADRAAFPVLLSNGERVDEGALPGGRHFAVWADPWPKPCYLFALVAGDLAALEDRFVTRSGRDVALAIWTAEADVPRARHAMASLKQAMRWDEERYGREYDLDRFNIVAVSDFNFGAMENKGLNIFNARYVLADSATATDQDFDAIAAVVAHEYFHNWSGNRVTCRDWFQLALKEGFTVFRDQQFSESLGSPVVKRIEAVRSLRAQQFPEDDGPLAHPVRPDAYQEISNFYTATIYGKGAELIRMMCRLMGADAFRRGTDRYFAAHDGTAATIDDFLGCMAAEGLDSAAFRAWYDQAGTPRLTATVATGPDGARIRLAQHNPRAGADAAPLLMPVDVALFAADGTLLFRHEGALAEPEQLIVAPDVAGPAILSANRGFAAPVLVEPAADPVQLALIARAETEPFQRYEAVQQLMLSALIDSVGAGAAVGADLVAGALGAALANWAADPALAAETLLLPAESLMGDRMARLDPAAVHAAREAMRAALRERLEDRLWAMFRAAPAADPQSLAVRDKGLRRLGAISLSLLMAGDPPDAISAAFAQFSQARTMTERLAALTALSHSSAAERDEALALFYRAHEAQPEVLDRWFAVQAASSRPDTLAVVERLAAHPRFDQRNPNRLRALVLGFGLNQARFHAADGGGYAFLAAQIRAVDSLNPQSAARLAAPLARWRRLVEPYAGRMREALMTLGDGPALSPDLQEVVSQSLR